jgi:hypothetical protein
MLRVYDYYTIGNDVCDVDVKEPEFTFNGRIAVVAYGYAIKEQLRAEGFQFDAPTKTWFKKCRTQEDMRNALVAAAALGVVFKDGAGRPPLRAPVEMKFFIPAPNLRWVEVSRDEYVEHIRCYSAPKKAGEIPLKHLTNPLTVSKLIFPPRR